VVSPVLSVVVVVWSPDHNLWKLLPDLREAATDLGVDVEIIVCGSDRVLPSDVSRLGATVISGTTSRYGEILQAGLARSRGEYVVTMDGDFSHRPRFIRTMWAHRDVADVLMASRYVSGSFAEMPLGREIFSRLLNLVYRKVLALPYRDISSGFRLYRRAVLTGIGTPQGKGLDILPELIVKPFCEGWKIAEVPFWYQAASPFTRTRLLRLGFGFLGTLGRLFALRNSVKAADYDHRAFDSWIPLQRYWQRTRFRIIHEFVPEAGPILDIGCGSSRIVQTLPGAVGMDLALRKLRWLRAPGRMLLQGDMNRLPFRDSSFECVVCSEVIEHIPRNQVHLSELFRVIRPGGFLVLGTPDYGKRLWRALEWTYGKVFPGGYVKEHINRYTYSALRSELEDLGLEVIECAYVGRSEMIFKARRRIDQENASLGPLRARTAAGRP
jgi:ubiquinone/menaquinone biosynthesis C-methylase UbiE